MFGIGGFELLLILVFAFLVFGPDKLPEIAKTIGKGIAKFRMIQEDMSSQIKSVGLYDKDSDEPFKNPFTVAENVTAEAREKSASVKENLVDAVAAVGETATAAQEGFAERKAKYDAERRARKEAEAAAAANADLAPSDTAVSDTVNAADDSNPKQTVTTKTITEESD